MRISEILKQEDITFSLEVFPPKTSEKYSETAANAMEIAPIVKGGAYEVVSSTRAHVLKMLEL